MLLASFQKWADSKDHKGLQTKYFFLSIKDNFASQINVKSCSYVYTQKPYSVHNFKCCSNSEKVNNPHL